MPPLPSVTKVVRVELLYSNNASTTNQLNRLFFEYSGSAGTTTEMNAFASAISSYWATHCASLLPTEAEMAEVKCVDLSTESSPIGSYSTGVAGTRSGTPNSAQLAFMVQMTIARRYRGGKPKTFLPYGTAADLTNVGSWGGSFITAVTTGWNAFIAAVIADTNYSTFSQQVNVSYYEPPNIIVTNPVTGRARTVSTVRTSAVIDPILSYVYESKVATQRRRTGRKR